jgi:aminopeptidase-like protein
MNVTATMQTLQVENAAFLRQIREILPEFDPVRLGHEMHARIRELYPICRSITGNGVRETLRRIRQWIPLEIHEVPSGTPVFDWVVPREWNIRDAFIKNAAGQRVVDFQKSNLHVVNYSIPFHGKMRLAELKNHLFTLPDRPDWIPYRTSYYSESWGFCLSHRDSLRLADEEYEVYVDSTLEPGHLTYGEYALPGTSSDEVLVSTHICHPSLANDNLSGMMVAAHWARCLQQIQRRRFTYRFLFIPGTIGAITWLARNETTVVPRIRHGLVLSGVGDSGSFTYKRSRQGDAVVDRVLSHLLGQEGLEGKLLEFSPYGYDERQFCSPGLNLPVGRLSRSVHGTFPEYHTSADNLDFVRANSLEETLRLCLMIFRVLEANRFMLNLNPKCEPQLGRRGLYRAVGGQADAGALEMAMLWVLNLADGTRDLLAIAERASLPFSAIETAVRTLEQHQLLEERIPGKKALGA